MIDYNAKQRSIVSYILGLGIFVSDPAPVYKPHPQQRDFIEPFEEVVSKIRSDVEVLILGDFNICFKKANTGKQAHLFKMYSDVLNILVLINLLKIGRGLLTILHQLYFMQHSIQNIPAWHHANWSE